MSELAAKWGLTAAEALRFTPAMQAEAEEWRTRGGLCLPRTSPLVRGWVRDRLQLFSEINRRPLAR